MNIGIFAGTFDPIHTGHTSFIKDVLSYVDKVVIMTERAPRRKVAVTDYKHRKKMIELAIADSDEVDFLEVPEDTFTLNTTFDAIKRKYGADTQYSLIMGADVVEYVDRWQGDLTTKQFEEQLAGLSFLIALRTEDDGEIAVAVRDRLQLSMEMIVSRLSDVSSSKIRQQVHSEKQFRSLHPDVLQYIHEHKLYEAAPAV